MVAQRYLAVGLLMTLAGCAGGGDRGGFIEEDRSKSEPSPKTPGNFGELDDTPPAAPETPEVHEVYGHSATTLYKLQPVSKEVSIVGDFDGCASVIDIALDEQSTLYAVSSRTLYTVDKETAVCTVVSIGDYPNSLSFVPKGTLDDKEEALVGYGGARGDEYLRIDVKSGTSTTIGRLGGDFVSSGDIVSVKGGKTFLTVKGSGCMDTDCLVEIDPKTGLMVKNWGSIQHRKVFGLAFWGGNVYGFDDQGSLFEVTFDVDTIATSPILIPNRPADLRFWGAGSSTSAPLTYDPH